MKLPRLEPLGKNNRQIVSFGGINKTDSYNEGEIENCKNLSSERFPALYPSKEDKLIWETEGLSDIFWHKNGYLTIIDNELSFTRYAEKNKIEVVEVGWYETFHLSNVYIPTSYSTKIIDGETAYRVYCSFKESISTERAKDYVGKSFSFDAEGNIVYTLDVVGNGYFYAYIKGSHLKTTELYGSNSGNSIIIDGVKCTTVYVETQNPNRLFVTAVEYGGNAARVEESLTEKQLENLKDMEMTLEYNSSKSETRVIIEEIYWEEKVPYVKFNKKVSGFSSGYLYPYEHRPLKSQFTDTESISDEPTGSKFSNKDYLVYKDTFSKPLTNEKKQICVEGNFICIFPDKVYFDTENLQFGYLESYLKWRVWKFTTNTLEIALTDDENPFKVGDSVTFDYLGFGENNDLASVANAKTAIIKEIAYYTTGNTVFTFNSNTFKAEKGDVDGVHYGAVALENVYLTMKREVPELEYICSSGGRLYGTEGNKIHASKYGSPQNFQFFQGGSSDSYYIEVSSPGEFTGCIPYSSYVLFFKENEIIKLYGDKPSEYQIVSTAASGVAKGSERSLVEINGMIFYLGTDGVYSYSGGYPIKISKKLGDEILTEGVGGRLGSLYILSGKTKTGEYKTYTYDTVNGIWLSEEMGAVKRFFSFNEKEAYHNEKGLSFLNGGEYGEFSAEFCTINENVFNKKKYQRLYLRVSVPEGASLNIEVSFDGAPYQEIKRIAPSKSQVVNVPIFPNRSDRVKIRLSGRGEVKVLSLMREFIAGSER